MLPQGALVADKYRLLERIGEGGMGEVWRAETPDGATVAVKLIRPEIADSSEQAYERFEREARAAAAVQHKNVIDVLDHGSMPDGTPYLAMEYLQGRSLEEVYEKGPTLRIRELARYIADALGGLSAIHERGIVHRDLKPSNVFLAEIGDGIVPKLLDFGIARQATAADGVVLPTLTRTGEALGTPHYMSPEQIRASKTVDHRSDLYSAGVILYEGLAGRRPFDGPSAPAVIAAIVTRDAPPLSGLCPAASPAMVAVVEKALQYDADDRFQSAREMREALLAAAEGATGSTAPRGGSGSVTDLESARTMAAETPPSATAHAAPPPPPRRTRRAFLTTIMALGTAGVGSALALFLALNLTGGDEGDAITLGERGGSTTKVPDQSTGGLVRNENAGPHADTLPALALLWRDLPLDEREAPTSFRHGPSGWAAGAPVATRELDTRDPLDPGSAGGETLTPAMVRTTVSLNLRASPGEDGALLRVLPAGSILVALLGTVDGQQSEDGGQGTWAYVVASANDVGWSAGRFLQPHRGCVPDEDALLSDVPADRRAVVRDDMVYASARIRHEGVPTDAWMLVSRDPDRRTSYVSIHRSDVQCDLTPVATHVVEGVVEDVLLVDSAPDGGETLLVVAWRRHAEPEEDGSERWTVRHLGSEDTVWEASLPTSQSLPRWRRAAVTGPARQNDGAEAGYWPLVVRNPDRTRTYYRWNGRTLVADRPPAP